MSFLFPIHAVRYFKEGRPLPDIIVCDYEMPKMDGGYIYNFFESVGFKGRFYFLTGLAAKVEALMPLYPKAELYTKPFTKDTIRQILKDCPSVR